MTDTPDVHLLSDEPPLDFTGMVQITLRCHGWSFKIEDSPMITSIHIRCPECGVPAEVVSQ